MSVHEQLAGDLALYALGALDDAERQKLEKHLEECVSCRRELELLRGDLSLLALTTAGPQPPARARQRLIRSSVPGGLLLGGLLWDGRLRLRSFSSASVCCGRIRCCTRT